MEFFWDRNDLERRRHRRSPKIKELSPPSPFLLIPEGFPRADSRRRQCDDAPASSLVSGASVYVSTWLSLSSFWLRTRAGGGSP